MNSDIHLGDLRLGERAVVEGIFPPHGDFAAMHRRLLDIGLVSGAEVECVGKSPCGDPSAYRIRGAIVAIRAEDGRYVLVQRR